MDKAQVKQIFESDVASAGNLREGSRRFNKKIKKLVETAGLQIEDVGLLPLFESMCDPNGDINRDSSADVAEAMTAAGFPTVVGTLIHPTIIAAYEPMAKPALSLVRESTTKTKNTDIGGFGAVDNLEEVQEGTDYEEAASNEKYATIKAHKHGRIMSITKEMVMEDQTGEAIRRAESIGNKTGLHIHRTIIQKVCDIAVTDPVYAANTSMKINGSTRTMFANDHSSWDTFANDNLGGAVLGTTGLTAARLLFSSIMDEKGDLISVMPKTLLVPDALELTAEILASSAFVPGSGNNDVNVFKNKYNIVSSPYIDTGVSATAYYLGDFKRQYHLLWMWKPMTETLRATSDKAFRSDTVAQFKVSYKAGFGASDYRYVVQGNT